MSKSALLYYISWMWRHIGTQHWNCLWKPTDYEDSALSGSKIQNRVITGNSSQHRWNGPLWSTSWKLWADSNNWPCWSWRSIRSDCITLLQSSMTSSNLGMALFELWLRAWLDGTKTCSLQCSLHGRSCPNVMLKWLQGRVWFTLLHISSIVAGWCDYFGRGTMEWIPILRTRHPVLPNTRRPFWSMWQMNTGPNIDLRRSINPKSDWTNILSSPQRLWILANHPLIDMICLVMTKNT